MVHSVNIKDGFMLISDTGLSGNDSIIFSWLRFRSYKGEHDIRDNNETIAHYCGISTKTVTRRLKSLVRRGLIIILGVGRWRRIALTAAGMALGRILGRGVPVIDGQGVPVDGNTHIYNKKTFYNNGNSRQTKKYWRRDRVQERLNQSGAYLSNEENDAALARLAALMQEMGAGMPSMA